MACAAFFELFAGWRCDIFVYTVTSECEMVGLPLDLGIVNQNGGGLIKTHRFAVSECLVVLIEKGVLS